MFSLSLIDCCFWQLFPAAAWRFEHRCDAILSSKHSNIKTASLYAKGANIKRHLTWPRHITTLFVKRCLGDILSDKMAISIRGFTGFWPLWALAWVGGIYFTGESLMKWRASICKSEIKLSFFFPPHILPWSHKKFTLCWLGEGGTTNSLWLVSHPFSTLMKMLQRKLLVVVVCGGRRAIWGCAKPKIKMTAMTRLDAEQIYPTDASRKLNNPCRLYLCVMCVCMCLSLCMRVCVWCSVQYVRLLTRSWRLSVKLDSWLQAGVNTWHHACLQLRWIIAHVRGLKCQNEGMENNICEVNGGGNRSMWKMLYWLLDLFAWVKKFLIWFNSLKRWFDRWAPTAPSDEPVPLHQHCHLFEPFMIIFS